MFSYLFIIGQVLLASYVQSNSFCGFGRRLDNDFLLVKDVVYSRPAGYIEPAGISFKYNVAEPITYIHIESEKDMFANVKLSYINNLVGGLITLVQNETDEPSTEFDVTESPDDDSAFNVTIQIFGFNVSTIGVNQANLLCRDMSYEGKLEPDLRADYEDDLENKDKIITVGERQEGDDLIYETSQTSPDDPSEQTNCTVVLYYIDSAFITYVKFVIGDHFANKISTDESYLPPVAEYSHFSPGTLKATITDFQSRHLFVQMFIYGYIGLEAPPNYKPFLAPPHWSRTANLDQHPHWTPLQKLQLEMMTGKKSTESPQDFTNDNSEDDSEEQTIRAEDMVPDHIPNGGAIADQRTFVEQRLYAMLGMMLFAVA